MVHRLMHVALNLVFLVPGEVGGMEVYARELVPRLARRSDLRVTCLVNREAAEAGDGPWGQVAPMQVVPVRARRRVEWVRGEQQIVPRMARWLGADVVHSMASTAPLWGAQARVTTIHDINYLMVPESHFGLRALGMRVLVPAAARRSHRIVVPSEATRRDLRERLGVPNSKVDVVPEGAAPPVVPPTPAAVLRQRLDLGDRPVVLSPGSKRPHKNLKAVIEALASMPAESRPRLVASGYATPYESELLRHADSVGLGAGEVVFPAWLVPADLEGLYALASVVVFVSRYEGFGLPVLEAMIRGVPVVTSNRASLPEVAGDAALVVDPDRPVQIRMAIERLLGDAELARRMRDAGRVQAARFSWERTAELTAASYIRAVARAQ